MTERQPVVSVMMPAYNAEMFIADAVASLKGQTLSAWELVVVDDGSTDNTASIMSELLDPRITLVSQTNAGEAVARNRALDIVRGEFVAFLDADDRFLPDHLSECVGYLRAHAGDDAVYTDGYHIDADGKRGSRLSSRRRGPFNGDIFEEVVRASDVFGPPICVVVRRKLIEEGELRFDPKIVIGPDWDFWVQASQVGRFGYIDLPTCEYRVHGANITFAANDRVRRESLARCREKAVETSRFEECSVEVRTAVFYDLLINQLFDRPDEQRRTVRGSEFVALPRRVQARLLRRMVSQNLASGRSNPHAGAWLRMAIARNPFDPKAWALCLLFALGSRFSQVILQQKTGPTGQRSAQP